MAIKTRKAKLYPPVEKSFALSVGLDETEWDRIVDRLGRPPNHFECKLFTALWSEEVSLKNSSALLKTIERKQEDVSTVPGSKIGTIEIGSGVRLAMSVSHCNPSLKSAPEFAVNLASTRAIESLISIGAKPVATTSLTRVGDHNQLDNQRLFRGVASGLNSFGVCSGLPIVDNEIYFHEDIDHGAMINSGVIGLVSGDSFAETIETPFKSPVLYIGAETGKDGLRSEENGQKRLSIGDPLLSQRLISAINEGVEQGLIKHMVTCSYGGIAIAAINLSERVGKPVMIDIDRIPLRRQKIEQKSDPLDIVLSETPSRALVVVERSQHRALNQILTKWDLASLKVGETNDADGVQFYWNHYLAADIPFEFTKQKATESNFEVVKFPPMLKRGASDDSGAVARKRKKEKDDEWSLVREATQQKEDLDAQKEIHCPDSLEDPWLNLLTNPNLCSRDPLISLIDQSIGGAVVAKGDNSAAVIRLSSQKIEAKALAVTIVSNSLYVSKEPYLGTVQTIATGLRQLAAVGASPIATSYCLNFGDPEDYREVADMSESIRGLGDATRIWNIPILSKNVSLGNGKKNHRTLPTPTFVIAGLVDNYQTATKPAFKDKGDVILLLGRTFNEIHCSEYSLYEHDIATRLVPDIDFEKEIETCQFVTSLVSKELLQSALALSRGGLAIALTECCLRRSRPVGANFKIEEDSFKSPAGPIPLRRDAALFSETSGRFLISCKPENEQEIIESCKEANITVSGRGTVGGSSLKVTGAVEASLPLSTTYKLWEHRLERLLGF